MSDRDPSTQSCTSPMRALARGREVLRQISNPTALGLLGLALAVTLWGYGYRLSQYSDLFGSRPRLPAAKLWIDQRFESAGVSSTTTAPNLKARIDAHSGTSAIFVAATAFPCQGVKRALFVTARPRAIPFLHAAIPLRSPPLAVSL